MLRLVSSHKPEQETPTLWVCDVKYIQWHSWQPIWRLSFSILALYISPRTEHVDTCSGYSTYIAPRTLSAFREILFFFPKLCCYCNNELTHRANQTLTIPVYNHNNLHLTFHLPPHLILFTSVFVFVSYFITTNIYMLLYMVFSC